MTVGPFKQLNIDNFLRINSTSPNNPKKYHQLILAKVNNVVPAVSWRANELKRKISPPDRVIQKHIKTQHKENESNDDINSNQPLEYCFQNSEFNDLINKETYSNYRPMKLNIGKCHSYNVVESRSLESVESPDIDYVLAMPRNVITARRLSNVQLEAIVYACQAHNTFIYDNIRTGFLIGDGAGVGKGRTIAGIIYENMLHGKSRSIWISISNDLIEDARRDFRDIRADVNVISLCKLSYKKSTCLQNDENENEVLFGTYSSLICATKKQDGNSFSTRMNQIVQWFGESHDGVIIFDECHKAKNLSSDSKQSKAAMHVKLLQDRLPNARIVYSSATGASEPGHMAYMVRLGLWGPNKICTYFSDFERKLKRHGVSSMELIAMDMKRKGIYVARQLSFTNIKFDILEIKMEEEKINGHTFKNVYNKCVEIWTRLYAKFKKTDSKLDRMYWGAHQRFFKYLCISGKVSSCVKLALNEVKEGRCVVIGLQSTGESRINEALRDNDGELSDFVSSAKEILKSLIINHYPGDRAEVNNLLDEIALLDDIFPPNTLDQLITELGGADKVAEMTGRKGRVVRKADGSIQYEQRKNVNVSLDQMNIDERNKFNDGKKLIAIISDAASTGISLHSDSRFKNKHQRVHITLELPWSADKAIQQFGRTHRSNQVIPPHYKFIISDLAGERRFAASVAKRLECLGALTHGDRKAADSKDLSQFNFENDIGCKAVNKIIRSILFPSRSTERLPAEYLRKYNAEEFLTKARDSLTKVGISIQSECTVSRFLNRLLGIEIDVQNELFQYFIDTIEYDTKQARSKDEYDHGIRDVVSDSIHCDKVHEFCNNSMDNGAKITISKVIYINDGLPWKEVLERYKEDVLKNYFCVLKGQNFNLVALVLTGDEKVVKMLTPVFPEESINAADLDKKWQRITLTEAESAWKSLLRESENNCLHRLMENKCLKRFCTYGKRTKFNYMITGAIFLARSIIDDSGKRVKIDVARLKLNKDEKLIGAFFSPNEYDKVISILNESYQTIDLTQDD